MCPTPKKKIDRVLAITSLGFPSNPLLSANLTMKNAANPAEISVKGAKNNELRTMISRQYGS